MNVIEFIHIEHDVTQNPCRLFGIMLQRGIRGKLSLHAGRRGQRRLAAA